MNNYKDLGIEVTSRAYTGDSIKIDRLLNKEIAVLYYKIEDSTKKPGTKYVCLQIEYDGQKRVLFSGATALLEAIQKVPVHKFPFMTTIVKNDRFEFS